MPNPSDSAFPTPHFANLNGDIQWGAPGLTIREHFAALALQGYLANVDWTQEGHQRIAHNCVLSADALIAELAKPEGPSRLELLITAVRPLLAEAESELEQRRTSGNAEDVLFLEQVISEVKEQLP